MLGFIEGLVRIAYKLGRCELHVRYGAGHTDAGGEAQGATFKHHFQAGNICPEFVRQIQGVAQRAVDQQHGKFLATVAGQQITCALHFLPHVVCQGPEAGVPCGVAIGVVDGLEMVNVQQQQGQRLLEPARALVLGDQGLVEESAVADLGQAVGHGQTL